MWMTNRHDINIGENMIEVIIEEIVHHKSGEVTNVTKTITTDKCEILENMNGQKRSITHRQTIDGVMITNTQSIQKNNHQREITIVLVDYLVD